MKDNILLIMAVYHILDLQITLILRVTQLLSVKVVLLQVL